MTQPTEQDLLAATVYKRQFEQRTGHTPVGPVTMEMRRVTARDVMAGLEAQVEFKGADGKPYLKTIFSGVRVYRREKGKYLPLDEDRKHAQLLGKGNEGPGTD